MDSNKQQILDAALAKVTQAQTDLTAAQTAFDKQNGIYLEYKRQYDVHTATGYQEGAAWAKSMMDLAKIDLDSKLVILNQKKTAYTTAQQEYNDLKNTLLNPEEKAEQEAKEQALAANYATKTTKYWIIGGIVLVIVIIAGVIIYYKRKGS